ncbi:hypothetical protein Pint_07418 [Pistacia integerrima]|uniref:Uncharacterized protein n=1 Tax=Pistacia integerrima TaxID=434235 RepID=A0ACC0XSI7_9ROSI|nr:hypothetical protein Pint_07418 [Pistacia integerrima]
MLIYLFLYYINCMRLIMRLYIKALFSVKSTQAMFHSWNDNMY